MGRFKFAVHDEVEVLVVVQGAYKTHYVPLDTWECHFPLPACHCVPEERGVIWSGYPLGAHRQKMDKHCPILETHEAVDVRDVPAWSKKL
ncbi:hypothetical protein PHMEG_00026965 [Phytophthora megakarya]|uniref:Uncharacterized protein n=1 Tax=Phytophthora megakarya TaxID=4795 RepID=A0A225V8A6_9STRA|nr:hypothetical protein PHMEG_00026965 [Phytophthora megakarya]